MHTPDEFMVIDSLTRSKTHLPIAYAVNGSNEEFEAKNDFKSACISK